MTALTAPAQPHEGAGPRPVPWRRMAWVTWRQHRITLAGVAVFLGALAVALWLTGRQLHHAYAAAIACHPASSVVCGTLVSRFNGMDDFLANGFILQAAPALIGVFAGAPVLARELETGTFRYVWTQGFRRWRWTLAKLVPLAIAVAVAAGVFSVLLSWYYQPYFNARNQALNLSAPSAFYPGLFALRGIAFAAWTLTAFAIGGLAGLVIRRVVPAMIATLAGYAGLAFAAGLYLREHYLPALVTSNLNVPASAWVFSQWWTKNGRFLFNYPSDHLLRRLCPPSTVVPVLKSGKPKTLTIAQCISQHGYTQWTSYDPASRFWPFQWIETGWLLALSALLIAATVWLVGRRAA